MGYFIGVDTGGTFTDVVILDGKGGIYFDKAFSTPREPARGVHNALENCVQQLGCQVHEVLEETERFTYGTTAATNALIQRKGARVGLLMTKGFEDTLFIARGHMGRTMGIPLSQALDFFHTERPEPLVPKGLTRGVAERIAVDGEVVAPLVEQDVVSALEHFRKEGVESIACCLLSSFRNESHEKKIKAILRELDPSLPVYLSCEVSPLLGEFERAVTTVVCAYLGPVVFRYVQGLQRDLDSRGLKHPVQIMKSSGGLTLLQDTEREAVAMVNSGPVGGLVAAKYLGGILGHQNILTTDMGGTSFDVGVIFKGEYEQEKTPFLSQGLPSQVPAVKVVTIGAGGGSIAWTDGRRLMVGPLSAGADPGPACYDTGGTEPTVTDALIVLGLLDPEHFFGGRKRLNRVLAEVAIRKKIAEPLGLDLLQAASGIYEIVTAKMSDLVRKVTVESGFDPREFVLLAYGGANPAHCALYAETLGVREVVIPHTVSVFSALGIAFSDPLYTFARSEPLPLAPKTDGITRFNAIFEELETQALEMMAASGFSPGDAVLSRKLDLRYAGQMNEITIPVERKPLTPRGLGEIRQNFEQTYEARFGQGTTRAESPLEAITFRVEALKITEKPHLRPEEEKDGDPRTAQKGEQKVYLRQFGLFSTKVYDYDQLVAGIYLPGPAIIQRRDTTVFVPPAHQAKVDSYYNIRIQRGLGR